MVANLADDRAADGRNIYAVIDRDMQVDIDPAVGRFGHLYAARPSRCASPSVIERMVMPFTPKQSEAA